MNDIIYVSVTELNNDIKKAIDNNPKLQDVYLKGEISNFKNHSRGHWYFTLKDEESRINGVMFAGSTKNVKFLPQDGMKVLIRGKVSAYPASGSYQIYVVEMLSDGLGNLHIAFEQLKKKLEAEGLFDKLKKKKIPKMPKKIGIITAPTGAAIKDIITTLKRRFPLAETLLLPSLVQGGDAAPSIVEQIKRAENYNLDVLIVGRGGGSIEDLWAFNEEIVARAIYECTIPVVSAVGHEIDFTIADFVADLRAPTPTAAAELVVPNQIDIFTYLKNANIRMNIALKKKLDYLKLLLNKYKSSYILKNPISMYQVKEQNLDVLIDKLNSNMSNNINNKNKILDKLISSYILKNPKKILENKINNLNLIVSKLQVLNPLNVLDRGYAVVRKDEKIINLKKLKINDEINIKLKEGNIISKVTKIEGV